MSASVGVLSSKTYSRSTENLLISNLACHILSYLVISCHIVSSSCDSYVTFGIVWLKVTSNKLAPQLLVIDTFHHFLAKQG
jgi:hypothetical protein